MSSESDFAAEFDQDEFEYGVRHTMRMGMPEDDAEKLTWFWKRDREYSPDDLAGAPYDFSSPPVIDDPGNPSLPDDGEDQSLIVDYAIEFSSRPAGSVITVLGEVDNSRAVITLLAEDFQKIKTADYAKIDGTEYRIQFTEPPIGLFISTVYSVILEAIDEK